MNVAVLVFITSIMISCNSATNKSKPNSDSSKIEDRVVCILPLGQINKATVITIQDSLRKIFNNVQLLDKEEMSASAYYKLRGRYRADTLIRWMSRRAKENEVYVGITEQDISTTKGQFADYGVMGLGFQPGKACVVSNFRLKYKRSFYKVVIHELGHTAGLPHCPNKYCFMRDAEGGDHTTEEKGFCDKCKSFLQRKGWRV